jgi:site-specific DNA recombinase
VTKVRPAADPRRISSDVEGSALEHTLYSATRQTTLRYVCLAGPDHNGCGRLTVVAPPVEELITKAVLYRLDTQELAVAKRSSRVRRNSR